MTDNEVMKIRVNLEGSVAEQVTGMAEAWDVSRDMVVKLLINQSLSGDLSSIKSAVKDQLTADLRARIKAIDKS